MSTADTRNPIEFDNVSFVYPAEAPGPDGPSGQAPGAAAEPAPPEPAVTPAAAAATASVTDSAAAEAPPEPAPPEQIFGGLTLQIPHGVTSLVGPNGMGKSTFLLLAGARLFPTAGAVSIFGRDTREFAGAESAPELESKRNELVSFVYQNMEFESEQPLGELLDLVYEAGIWEDKSDLFTRELIELLELGPELGKRTGELSKGGMQRAVIAFSLLYGSRIIAMDEPVFALEENQKQRVFEYLVDVATRYSRTVLFSAHELNITESYSDNMLLFGKDGSLVFGPTKEVFTRDSVERAYQVPYDLLHHKEQLYREMLSGGDV